MSNHMLYSIVILLVGFVAGLFYSRGKADPVQAALFDLKRHIRMLRDNGIRLWQWLFK